MQVDICVRCGGVMWMEDNDTHALWICGECGVIEEERDTEDDD